MVQHKKDETNPIARETRVGGERQTDGYRTCSELSQCYKAQLYRFTQYKWTHLQIQACSYPWLENKCQTAKVNKELTSSFLLNEEICNGNLSIID